jgi:hypothetical protein
MCTRCESAWALFRVTLTRPLRKVAWHLWERSRRLQSCLHRVLRELCPSTLLTLRREPKLEVLVFSPDSLSVWAYFPMHPRLRTLQLRVPERGTKAELISVIRAFKDDLYRRRLAAQAYRPKPATRVLLVLGESMIEAQRLAKTKDELRHHIMTRTTCS